MIKKIFFFLIGLSIQTDCIFSEVSQKPTICLNMIVKNEANVIERCLESALPIIDYWVIVDTGSCDGTQEIIKNYMQKKGIPGELYEEPWVDFAHNRNQALHFAKGKADYLLFIDADDVFVLEPYFNLPHLNKDFYYITMSFSGTNYGLVRLVNNHLSWKWKGVLHEYPSCSQAVSYDTLNNIINLCSNDGVRSKNPDKYKNDAEVLELALKKEPNNLRYMFYLAQSYRDSMQYEKSLEAYEKRLLMGGGWDEEVFYCLYQIASLKEVLNHPSDEVVEAYLNAYKVRPTRVEPLYRLMRYYRINKNYEAGYKVGKIATQMPISDDILFLEKWLYDYGIPFELSICAYWNEKYEETVDLCLKVAKTKSIPDGVKKCNYKNLSFAISKIIEQISL